MVRTRVLASLLLAVSCLAVVVPAAHAGGGPGQGLPPGTTTCRFVVNGANPSQVINLQDALGDNLNVQIGPAVLVCDLPVTATIVKGPALTTVTGANAVTCYSVAGPSNNTIAATITDPFATGTFQVAGFRLLCVPAAVE